MTECRGINTDDVLLTKVICFIFCYNKMTNKDGSQESSIFGVTTYNANGEPDPNGQTLNEQSEEHGGDANKAFGKAMKHVECGTCAHLKRASELLQKYKN